jgi:hypothetical protein
VVVTRLEDWGCGPDYVEGPRPVVGHASTLWGACVAPQTPSHRYKLGQHRFAMPWQAPFSDRGGVAQQLSDCQTCPVLQGPSTPMTRFQ